MGGTAAHEFTGSLFAQRRSLFSQSCLSLLVNKMYFNAKLFMQNLHLTFRHYIEVLIDVRRAEVPTS